MRILGSFSQKLARNLRISGKIRDFHQKWDFMYFQRENTDFEDKFAPNGQIYHDFEEI